MTDEKREYVIYACTEPGCSYYRDDLASGVHVVFPDAGKARRHTIAPLVVVPKSDEGKLTDGD